MLHEFPEIPASAALAVLQHHERLDGSGYPYRLNSTDIDRIARVLCVAEFCASLLERFGADKRITLKLWLNRNRYDDEAMGVLLRLFADTGYPAVDAPDEARLMARLSHIGSIFQDWSALRASFSAADWAAIGYLIERVDNLHRLLLESGFDQGSIDEILSLSSFENPEICTEIGVLLEEMAWRLKDVYDEVQRKVRLHGSTLAPVVRETVYDWRRSAYSFAEARG